MSDHGINVTYKSGAGYDDFWITVGANDADTWDQRNTAVHQAIAETAAGTAAMIRAVNAVAKQLPGAVTVSSEPPPATVASSPAPVATQPAAAVPAAVSPPLSVVQGDLPANVKIWQGPNPEKPQYTELFVDWPFNQPFADAVKAGMEAAGQRIFWNKTAKARVTKPANEALLRQVIVANKHLLGA